MCAPGVTRVCKCINITSECFSHYCLKKLIFNFAGAIRWQSLHYD